MQSPAVTSTLQALAHNKWGNGCDAWTLLNTQGMAIKQETMPAGTEEQLHYHGKAQQFFYILKGDATFEVDGVITLVHQAHGIHIEAGRHHKIMNNTDGEIHFLVCSQPSTENDRFNLA